MLQVLKSYYIQESERLIYRKITPDDELSWREFFVDNNRLHFVGLDPSIEGDVLCLNWINKQMKRYADGQLGMLSVVEKSSGQLIGMCGILERVIEGQNELEIAYSLKPKFLGKGYGTESAIRMKDFGFENNMAKRFVSMINLDNKESMRVAEKNGMTPLFNSEYQGSPIVVFATS